MSGADYHAMGCARTALVDAKNELIRSGTGSDIALTQLRHAEERLARQMDEHKARVAGAAATPNSTP